MPSTKSFTYENPRAAPTVRNRVEMPVEQSICSETDLKSPLDYDAHQHDAYDVKDFEPENVGRLIDFLRQVVDETDEIMGDDPNFPSTLLTRAAEALKPDVTPQEVLEIAAATRADLKLAEDNSPYPEVRACVDAFDDPSTPVMTFRMWFIGFITVILGTGLNQFFIPRLPNITINTTVAQLLSFPLGMLMARFLPTKVFRVGNRSFTLNPGPFNMKEHMLISIMANASFGGAYATDIIAVLKIPKFYNNVSLGGNRAFQISLVLSTQLMGYTLAGTCRSFLVYPRAMVWWPNLLQITVLRALHGKDNRPPVNGWKTSQIRFFLFCGIGYGIYFILPGVFFQALAFFNWTTWIAPRNAKLAMLTGTLSGLGLNPFPTLDWNFLYGDPIIVPLWAVSNVYFGMLCSVVAICVIYFNNILHTSYLPINSSGLFDRRGRPYNTSRILNEYGILDPARYKAYSVPYMSASTIVAYTGFFAIYSSTVVHSLIHYQSHVKKAFPHFWESLRWKKSGDKTRKSARDLFQSDVHYRLMQAYPEVPTWWFLVIGVVSLTLAIFLIEYYETQMPVWGIFFALALTCVFILPLGMMEAIASISAPLNVLAELVGGYALPGRPLANMLFKTYGYITMAQSLSYIGDMKLAHYVKIPPRTLFLAQTLATILSSFTAITVLDLQIDHFPDLCSRTQPLHFVCPDYHRFYSASILWGAVGPARLFSAALYRYCLIGFLIGALSPFIPWYAGKRWPRSGWRFVHTPLMIVGSWQFAPRNLAYVTPMLLLALFFQGYVKRKYTAWYEKYALTLTAGLSAGIAIFALIYFFAFQMNGQEYEWSGNTIFHTGCDGEACTLLEVPKEGFGIQSWE
ncbi:putative oligopeptide transporter [Melampsora larici-populina 98AG31]|uniref:Putative oligopeptide transporter n=1 Tax=Melampsora larici-populina (strain 98AG31 / pathotype 3-4-7) TaxID=747676 RepID=F4RS90_MELLP|nr:putative oligopeptide transporter [Melampsora larici-populina 98AG31]EGG04813.1 putative oligopeptide transporter [Melampsora larici-populina 98AG31]